ncbi:MAG: hypothetical protein R3B70_10930 [Polyangiaceae bacterium]
MGIVAGALTLAGAGCESGKSCEDLCAAADACADFPSETPCETRCKVEEEVVKASACEEQQEAFDKCRGGLKDICETQNFCISEVKTYNDCIDDFCAVDPGACADYCVDHPTACPQP